MVPPYRGQKPNQPSTSGFLEAFARSSGPEALNHRTNRRKLMQCLVGVNLKTEVASIAVLGQFAANSLTLMGIASLRPIFLQEISPAIQLMRRCRCPQQPCQYR